MKYHTLGLIGRFRPLHNGARELIASALTVAEHVVIGIGSANRYDARNPFTAREVKEMIQSEFSQRNLYFATIDDFGHIPQYRDGARWKQEVHERFGMLDALVTGNPYVGNLLADRYRIITPEELIPRGTRLEIKSSMVRATMAQGDDCVNMMPVGVATYLQKNGLVERFRREFGAQYINQPITYVAEKTDTEMQRVHI